MMEMEVHIRLNSVQHFLDLKTILTHLCQVYELFHLTLHFNTWRCLTNELTKQMMD